MDRNSRIKSSVDGAGELTLAKRRDQNASLAVTVIVPSLLASGHAATIDERAAFCRNGHHVCLL
jgi:hypothetical protein